MQKNEIILVGGGGHCRACIDVIEAEGKLKVGGVVDTSEKLKQHVYNYEIIGTDDDLEILVGQYKYFFVTVGQIKNSKTRVNIFNQLVQLDAKIPTIVSPNAYISKRASIGRGTIVMHGAVVNSGAEIGDNCIINSNAVIEHDVKIADHCHISTGCVVNGGVQIDSNTFVGSNTVINEKVSIASNTIIGSGAVVIDSISNNGLFVGSPVRRIK